MKLAPRLGISTVSLVLELLRNALFLLRTLCAVVGFMFAAGSDGAERTFYFSLPTRVNEAAGNLGEVGWIYSSEPAISDLTVQLESDALLQVPTSVTIPAGRSSAPFTISVGDDSVYDVAYAVLIRATAAGWADGEGQIPIIENDDPSFTISAPQFVYGNQSAEGEIRLNTPRRGTTIVSLQFEDGIGVTVPATVTVQPGETVTRFPITFLSPTYVARTLYGSIPVVDNVQWTGCPIITLPDDPVPHDLFGRDVPFSVRSGSVLRLGAILGYSSDSPQNTNAIGTLRLIDPAGKIQFPTQTIQFTNGVWSGEITLEGSGSALMLEYSAAGLTSLRGPFELIGGGELRAPVVEAQWNTQSQMFYISTASTTNAPPRLIAVTPTNPSVIAKSIDLPGEPASLTVSDKATTAWLALTNGKFLRIDLSAWTLGPQLDAKGRVRDMLLLPGEDEKFVAVLSGDEGDLSTWQAKLFVAGVETGASAALIFRPDTLMPVAELVRGRDSSEVFCSTSSNLFRLEVRDGLELAGQISLSGGPGRLRYNDGRLYHALGGVLDPQTLSETQRFEVPNSTLAILPVPELNRLFQFVPDSGENRICSFELSSRKPLSCWAEPMALQLSDAGTVVDWDRGFALKTDFGLAVIEPSIVFTGIADLAVRFLGPTAYTGLLMPWEFEVENLGPDIAFQTELVLEKPSARWSIGVLKPGEKWRGAPFYLGDQAFVQEDVRVVSPLYDPNPANNLVRPLTFMDLRPPRADWHSLPMAVSALAESKNRERVYAAFSLQPGIEGPGIAVVNGATATISRTVPTTSTVQKMEVTLDETFLFGLIETDRVLRWNLQSSTVDQAITVGNGPILDFTVAANDAVVIATGERCSLFKAGVELPTIIESNASRKAVKIVEGSLWLVEDNQLRRVEMSETGLSVVEGPFPLQNFAPQFVVDGDRFYFDLSTFNSTTRTTAPDGREENFTPSPLPIVFPELGALVTQNWQHLKVLKRDGLALVGEETLPQAAFLTNAVRFGERGIAFAGDRKELVLYNVSGVPLLEASADLSVSITPPLLYSRQPVTWEFTVTNHSEVVALNAKVVFYGDRIYQWQVGTNNDPQNYNVIPLGNLSGHQAKTVRVTAWIHDASDYGSFVVRARAISNSPDPSPENNEATFTGRAQPEPSHLRVTVTTPNLATLGETITIDYTIENRGPASLEQVSLTTTLNERPLNSPSGFALSAEETKTFGFQAKITQAGLLSVSGSAVALNHQNVDAGNFDAKLIFVPDAATPFEALALPGELRAANAPRGEVIAALTTPSGVAGVDPRTLEPQWFVPVDGYVGYVMATADGRYVWLTSGSTAMRVDIETRQVDRRFDVTDFDASLRSLATLWSVATPPGQPDVLLVSYSEYPQNFKRKTVAFNSGTALPNKLDVLGRLGISEEGRIFLAASGQPGLQELGLNETGLNVVTTFPTGESMAPIIAVGSKVFFSFGRILDVTTGTIDDSLRDGLAVVADANAGRVWRAYSAGRSYLESYNVASGAADWRVALPWEAGNFPFLAVAGNRVIISNDRRFRAGYDLTLPKISDLAVRGDVPVSVPGPGVEFEAAIIVTNQSAWLAGEVKLALDLPERTLVRYDVRRWIETNHLEVLVSNPLTHQLESSDGPFKLRLKLPTSGQHEIVARVSGANAESNLLNNEARFPIHVETLPVFLIDEITMLEGAGASGGWNGVSAKLTAPAPRDMEVNFTVTALNGEDGEILFPQSRFVFYQGRTDAYAAVFYDDSYPELTELLRMDFSADQIIMVRTQTVVTLLNDDFPVISAPPASKVTEGNSGIQPLVLDILSTGAPFETEVEFETVSDTALANRDFVPASGRLVFEPGELSKTVEIGIIGNTEFETNKQFTFRLKNARAATISPATTTIIIRPDDPPPAFGMKIIRDARPYVEFPVQLGVRYQLEYKIKITSTFWQTYPGVATIVGTTGRFALPLTPAATLFARVKATLQ